MLSKRTTFFKLVTLHIYPHCCYNGISWDYHNQVRNIWWHVNCQCDTWQQNYNHYNHWVGLWTIESWHFLWWAHTATFTARSTGLILIPLDIGQLFYCGFLECFFGQSVDQTRYLAQISATLMVEPSPWAPLPVMGSFIGYLSVNFPNDYHSLLRKNVHQLH